MIGDDGSLVTDEDLIWAYQRSAATAPVAPAEPVSSAEDAGSPGRSGWVPIIIGAAAYRGAMVPGRPRASTTH